MTNNIDRAADVIRAAGWDGGNAAEVLSRALADAGLLAPDLPTPDRDGKWWPTAASIGSVTISPAGEVVIHSGRFRDMRLYLTPKKATDLANILKAAAAHATQEG